MRTKHGMDRMMRHQERGHLHEICGLTGKVSFPSHEAALLRGGEILTLHPRRAQSFRAYLCSFCGLYHLTSSPK